MRPIDQNILNVPSPFEPTFNPKEMTLIAQRVAAHSPVKNVSIFTKIIQVAREKFTTHVYSPIEDFVKSIIQFFQKGTTAGLYKSVEGNKLATEEGLSQQIQLDFSRYYNIGKEYGNYAIEVEGKSVLLETVEPNKADSSISWQKFVPDSLKALLPDIKQQRMAMALMTQGALKDQFDRGMIKGGGKFLYTPDSWDFRFYQKDGQVFMETEILFKGKSLMLDATEKNQYLSKMTVDLSNPSAKVIFEDGELQPS